MVDVIIISLVVVAVVLVVRTHLKSTAQGKCSGCPSEGACSSLSHSTTAGASCCPAAEKTLHSMDESVKRAVAFSAQKH